jgi:hypothetical protein
VLPVRAVPPAPLSRKKATVHAAAIMGPYGVAFTEYAVSAGHAVGQRALMAHCCRRAQTRYGGALVQR